MYSKVLKGALCIHCVLFRAHIKHGSYQSSFKNTSFVHFHKFLEKARQHEKNDWHIESCIRCKDFMDMMKSNSGIDQILDSHYRNKIN